MTPADRQRPALRLTEAQWRQQVLEVARLSRWLCYHPWMSVRSAAGYPDLTLVKPPRVILAELKSEHGTLTPAQRAWITALQECPGIEVYVWRPSDWEQVLDCLRRTP